MKKTFFIPILLVVLLAFSFTVLAAKPKTIELPEQAGLYDVPGHPELKLRVFVYHEKPDKPGKPTPPPPTPSCGLPDPDSSSLVDSAGWHVSGTWKYKLNTSSVPATVGSNNLITITSNAYKQWTDAINNKITITKDSNTTVDRAVLDGQNIIAWGNAPGSALAVSYIWYNRTTKVATEVDTIMNTKFTWYWSQKQNCAYQGVYDAQDILTHELGHTFGLDDMYEGVYANHTMYGYGSKGEVKKDTLTQGDIISVQSIY